MRGPSESRIALGLGVIGLLAWPWSYAWIPTAGHNPDWLLLLVPIAELGAVACAIVAIWLGRRARRMGATSLGVTWGPRLGGLTLVLVLAGNVTAALLVRSA